MTGISAGMDEESTPVPIRHKKAAHHRAAFSSSQSHNPPAPTSIVTGGRSLRNLPARLSFRREHENAAAAAAIAGARRHVHMVAGQAHGNGVGADSSLEQLDDLVA